MHDVEMASSTLHCTRWLFRSNEDVLVLMNPFKAAMLSARIKPDAVIVCLCSRAQLLQCSSSHVRAHIDQAKYQVIFNPLFMYERLSNQGCLQVSGWL